jgi:hypothetical protein
MDGFLRGDACGRGASALLFDRVEDALGRRELVIVHFGAFSFSGSQDESPELWSSVGPVFTTNRRLFAQSHHAWKSLGALQDRRDEVGQDYTEGRYLEMSVFGSQSSKELAYLSENVERERLYPTVEARTQN